jgi:hypothetical protein
MQTDRRVGRNSHRTQTRTLAVTPVTRSWISPPEPTAQHEALRHIPQVTDRCSRFVASTRIALAELLSRSLSTLDIMVLMVDGEHLAERRVVALAITINQVAELDAGFVEDQFDRAECGPAHRDGYYVGESCGPQSGPSGGS